MCSDLVTAHISLTSLTINKGWKDGEIDKEFKAAREFSRPPSFTMLRNWTYNTKQILRELDHITDFIPDTPAPLEFLDVG